MARIGGLVTNGVSLTDDGTGLAVRPEVPADSASLWRYMGFAKLVDLLDRRALFFVRSDRLEDPFEGSLSKPCRKRIEAWADRVGDLDRAFDGVANFLRQDRKRAVVSCWYELEHESEAMWQLYASGGQGVAVRTDFGSLLASLGLRDGRQHRDALFGRISYVDYDEDDMRLFGGMPLFHKRKSFDHEREVRVAKWFEWKTQPCSGHTDLESEVINGGGIYWPVDLGRLIHEVVVSPLTDDWFAGTVLSTVAKLGSLTLPVRKSSLADPPKWQR